MGDRIEMAVSGVGCLEPIRFDIENESPMSLNQWIAIY